MMMNFGLVEPEGCGGFPFCREEVRAHFGLLGKFFAFHFLSVDIEFWDVHAISLLRSLWSLSSCLFMGILQFFTLLYSIYVLLFQEYAATFPVYSNESSEHWLVTPSLCIIRE